MSAQAIALKVFLGSMYEFRIEIKQTSSHGIVEPEGG